MGERVSNSELKTVIEYLTRMVDISIHDEGEQGMLSRCFDITANGVQRSLTVGVSWKT
jgi:hypothetical protein